MYSDSLSWWTTPSNVIQTINNNINHAVNVIENEFEGNNNDDEDEDDNDDENNENEINIYKKLLDDAQMQHVELSKQFRIEISEKNSEIEILKEKLKHLDNCDKYQSDHNDNEINQISIIKLRNENNALKDTLNDMENKMKNILI